MTTFDHIDPYRMPEPTHRAPIEKWSDETQQRIFEIFRDSENDLKTNAHRLVGFVMMWAVIGLGVGLGSFVAFFFVIDALWKMGGWIATAAALVMVVILAVFGFSVLVLMHLEQASEEDFKNIKLLCRKTWVHWDAPRKYEYSIMLWYLKRKDVESAREARLKLMEIGRREDTSTQAIEKPLM